MEMIRKFPEKNGMIMKEESQSFGFPTPPPKKKELKKLRMEKIMSQNRPGKLDAGYFFYQPYQQQKEPTLRNFHSINPKHIEKRCFEKKTFIQFCFWADFLL